MSDLKERGAVVTGSTRGIGLAIARALLEEGARVVVSARREKEVEQVSRELRGRFGERVFGIPCDVREASQVASLVQQARELLGRLDIWVNNAGIGIFKEVEHMTPVEWENVIRTNLDGVFYGCHYALPVLKESGGGFIINIGSLAGKNAFPGGAAYNASKFGLVGFSEALMQEVRYDDIRVAYIMPGSVDTDFSSGPGRGTSPWKLQPEDVAQVVVETLKRPGRCLTSRIEMRPSRPPRKG